MRHMLTGDHLACGIDWTQDPLAGALGIYSTNRATNPRNIGGDEGYCSRSTRPQAYVDRTRLAGPAGAGGDRDFTRNVDLARNHGNDRRRRPCPSNLHLDRLAGCLEVFPAFLTDLVRSQLWAGRRRSPTATGPG